MLLAAAVGALPPVAARCAAADGVSTSSVCAQPVAPRQQRRDGHSSALPLNRSRRPRFAVGGVRWGQKPARPRRGSAAPPLCPCFAVLGGSRRRAGRSAGSRRPTCLVAVAVGSSRPPPPPSPPSPVLLRAAAVGGACFRRPKGRPLRAPPLPPRPPFFRRGRGALVCAAAGIDVVAGMRPGHYMWCFIQWK